ncbi:MAG: Fic/DOC family N-terminal domain-containing protein [bacterium]|nr:Fic/DOC family N-terminal domain-containing protein [bacterium]
MTVKHNKPDFLKLDGLRLDHNIFANELAEANYALGLMESAQSKLRSSRLLISPLTAKEATVSSRIEGTQSTVSDVFLFEAGAEPRYTDTQQVANYRRAITFATNELKKGRTISASLTKSIHGILLENVRHKGRVGMWRNNIVYIANQSTDPIDKALYIPPEPHFVQDYMDNYISYLEKGTESVLIKAAIAHYQFEAVHPFDDGNGRVGRLLIPLIIFQEGKLSTPILYLSGYFDAHRDEYIEALRMTDTNRDYSVWTKFFLTCVTEQLKETQRLIEKIYKLHEDTKAQFPNTKSPYLNSFADFIFETPIFTVPQAQKRLHCTSLTVATLIKQFIRKNLMEDLGIRRGHAKLYSFRPLLKLL